MRILVYGADGWIGRQFTACIEADPASEYVAARARADDEEGVRAEISQVKPTHVISLIGRTHGDGCSTIDYLEQKGKLVENVRDNLFAPVILALACQEAKVHFTYLGTGCIFDSETYEPDSMPAFAESANPNYFGSSYSIVKGFTDRLMRSFSSTALNLRIRMPITDVPHPRNFITKITTYEKICSMPNSMSVLPELLPCALQLMQRGTTGTVNFTNHGTITHNEILQLYKELVDNDFTWQNFDREQQAKVLASGRSNNKLTTDRLRELCPEVNSIRDAVKTCLLRYRTSV